MKQFLAGILLAVFAATASRSATVNFFSPTQDIEIGKDSAEQAETQLALIHDPHLSQYLRLLAQRLQTNVPPRQVRYQFEIINSEDVMSLGFPNGSVYISAALLKLASNDDEVAAILAHEMGHISSRHPTSQLSRQLLVMA